MRADVVNAEMSQEEMIEAIAQEIVAEERGTWSMKKPTAANIGEHRWVRIWSVEEVDKLSEPILVTICTQKGACSARKAPEARIYYTDEAKNPTRIPLEYKVFENSLWSGPIQPPELHRIVKEKKCSKS